MRWLMVSILCTVTAATGCGTNGNNQGTHQCNDGKDNDGDGMVDFPDDLGCISPTDDSEDSPTSPQCSDGRDNDGDGRIDYPNDPGCFAAAQDDETDDCPDGPNCPQCSNGKDDDNNGSTDYPNDTGCASAADNDEYTENPAACGSNVQIKKLEFDGHETGTLMTGSPSSLLSPMCGGGGPEDVYELRITSPKVVVATTDNAGTTADTVLYVRSADCANNTSEMACNDDAPMATTMGASSLNVSIPTPGTYYLVVDAHDSGAGGNYDLSVKFLTGEGEACSGPDDCGPGLVCRVPLGGTQKVCSKHVCGDGVDDDGDGKADYPDDPGCTSLNDDDESDNCFPTPGPGCPECADGVDNDHDGKTDYPMDPTCTSASSASESCPSTDGVAQIVTANTNGDTTTSHHDVTLSCVAGTPPGPDDTYRIDVPALSSLDITAAATGSNGFFYLELLDHTCGGTALDCQDTFTGIHKTNLAANTYYIVLQSYSSDPFDVGPYTLSVQGKIANNASCEGALAASGALACNTGYACKGTAGSRTCQPALCSDGIDNDGDGKIDYPNDPGCTDPGDDTEANGAATVCSDGMDNDTDGQTDWPADFGCVAASGTSEVFCLGEMDVGGKITAKTTTGTTVGASADLMPGCGSSAAPEKTYALQLLGPVLDLQIDTIGSGFDTILSFRDPTCVNFFGGSATTGCNDDGGGSLTSKLNLANVPPGGYSITVDGYSSNSGAFTLNVVGHVGAGQICNTALFTGGANAVLSCAAGLTCSATTHKCQ